MKIEKLAPIHIKEGKKIFFASDVHLGLFPADKSIEREKVFVKWMKSIQSEAQVLFLQGDIFDFWYEYKKVVPRGFTRFLGQLTDFHDQGIEVHFFTGNHDVWVFDYLPTETGVILHRDLVGLEIDSKKFLIGHGDGVGSGDVGYRILKACFTSKILQFLFSRLHPNFAMWIGHTWSKHSRLSKGVAESFLGEEKEHQILFARDYLKSKPIDYFVFGHRHIPMDFKLSSESHLINLGEWIHSNTFAEFNGHELKIKSFPK
jgi:UDP-2,3-diacylglucosamine hydrolase